MMTAPDFAMFSLVTSSLAFQLPNAAPRAAVGGPSMQLDRRQMLSGAAAAAAFHLAPASALAPCPGGANNCFSTASTEKKTQIAKWRWPSSGSRGDALVALKSTLESYPQEGQAGVDLGGWKLASDDLADKGYVRYEFRSGIGKFAKFFNGGQPFVDDLEVSVEADSVCIRSSSRVGDSDFGVNAKRVNYIAERLRAQGWEAPGVGA